MRTVGTAAKRNPPPNRGGLAWAWHRTFRRDYRFCLGLTLLPLTSRHAAAAKDRRPQDFAPISLVHRQCRTTCADGDRTMYAWEAEVTAREDASALPLDAVAKVGSRNGLYFWRKLETRRDQ